VRLPTPLIERRIEGRRYHRGEMTDREWNSSTHSFLGEEREGQRSF
jgi:hypothetical protein